MSWPNRFPRSSILLAVLDFAAQVPASAQSAQMDAARAACSADLQQFCAGVQAGGGRQLACLKEHRDQVSAACTQAVKSVLQGSAGGAAAPAGQPTSGEAPTSGSTQGLAVIGPTTSSNLSGATFNEGSSGTNISGAFYFPYGQINQAGDSQIGDGSGQCLELIGSQVTLTGGSSLASSCNIPGVGTSGSSGLVSLVQ